MEVDSRLVRERLDKVWRGKAGRGGSRRGVLRPGGARQDKVAARWAKYLSVRNEYGMAAPVRSWRGKTRHGKTRQDEEPSGVRNTASEGMFGAWHGSDRRGRTRHGKARLLIT